MLISSNDSLRGLPLGNIGSGGGAGKVTAEWMMNGYINEDLFIYDIKRFQKFHSEINFITERITEFVSRLLGVCTHINTISISCQSTSA